MLIFALLLVAAAALVAAFAGSRVDRLIAGLSIGAEFLFLLAWSLLPNDCHTCTPTFLQRHNSVGAEYIGPALIAGALLTVGLRQRYRRR